MPEPPFDFAAHERRQKQFLEELKSAPVVEITGIIDASGAGGGKSRGETLWTLLFTLSAWRIAGGLVQRIPLHIRKEVNDADLKRFTSELPAYSVQQFRARIIAPPSDGMFGGLLEAVISSDADDTELKQIAKAMQEPVTCVDPDFGTLTLDRRLKRFVGNVMWNGGMTELTLDAADVDALVPALQAARLLFAQQATWSKRVGDFALQELLPLKNDAWLGDDESPLTADMFLTKMRLELISIDAEGNVTLWHNDGNLFWGHAIEISGNLRDGPTHADIPG